MIQYNSESYAADLGRIAEETGDDLDRTISLALEEGGDDIKGAFDSELNRITAFHKKKVISACSCHALGTLRDPKYRIFLPHPCASVILLTASLHYVQGLGLLASSPLIGL